MQSMSGHHLLQLCRRTPWVEWYVASGVYMVCLC